MPAVALSLVDCHGGVHVGNVAHGHGSQLRWSPGRVLTSVRVLCPQLKLPFPKADAPAADKHVIDLSLFDEEELTTVTTAEVRGPISTLCMSSGAQAACCSDGSCASLAHNKEIAGTLASL